MKYVYEIEAPNFHTPKRDKPAGEPHRPRPVQREPKPPREFVDLSGVPPSQWKMHDRLLNWAKWCNGRTGQEVSAGFSLHKTDEWGDREYGAETSVPVDRDDAVKLQKAVSALPDKHMRAVNWCYLKPLGAKDKARELGLSLQGLADMVKAGRQMLINRGV